MVHLFLKSALSLIIILFGFLFFSESKTSNTLTYNPEISLVSRESDKYDADTIVIERDIKIKHYFKYLDSLVQAYDSLTSYRLDEHLLVRANPWILDTLRHTDYYYMKAKDSFIYDQKQMVALPRGNQIIIPDSIQANKIKRAFEATVIDINVPEYILRIYQDSILLHEFSVRVGRHEKKYLEMSGRVQDLRTKLGEGFIYGYFKDPKYINPVNNMEYHVTKRDDLEITKLPQIPHIETEINGIRNGQLIHPTTNPITLGKAYSNGCIGTSEADGWVIYYHAPIGTKVTIRYNLNTIDSNGKSIELKDIYKYNLN